MSLYIVVSKKSFGKKSWSRRNLFCLGLDLSPHPDDDRPPDRIHCPSEFNYSPVGRLNEATQRQIQAEGGRIDSQRTRGVERSLGWLNSHDMIRVFVCMCVCMCVRDVCIYICMYACTYVCALA